MAPRGRDLRQPEKEDPFPVFIGALTANIAPPFFSFLFSSNNSDICGILVSGEKPDIWRDTPIRFLGYANELGESFRPILPKFVVSSSI